MKRREEAGLFRSRADLLTVKRLKKKTFEQCAGFLRVPGSTQPLDITGIHPESYSKVEEAARRLGVSIHNLLGEGAKLIRSDSIFRQNVGEYTFQDIVKELENAGRDIRDPFAEFHFRDDIHTIEDIHVDMICPGQVTNVTNFGAFVDIGIHDSGLLHVSQIESEGAVLRPGDEILVKIRAIDAKTGKFSLTLPTKSPAASNTIATSSSRSVSAGDSVAGKKRARPSSQRNTSKPSKVSKKPSLASKAKRAKRSKV